jgi:hypothetical protein
MVVIVFSILFFIGFCMVVSAIKEKTGCGCLSVIIALILASIVIVYFFGGVI